MPGLNNRVKADSEVICTELDDKEAVLLHLGTKAYFTLNPTGLRIWQMLSDNLTLGEICEKLQGEFDVSPEKAEESVLRLIGELIKEKLIKVLDE